MKSATWTTRDGEVIPISDMSDQHIINTMRMLRRRANDRDVLQQLEDSALSMLEYAASAPDGASMAAEGEAAGLLAALSGEPDKRCEVLWEEWPDLAREASLRGLSP